jgi:hypothetical protein
MKKITLLIITLLVVSTLFSQAPSKQALDSAKYQIIRATVDFLATDTKTFGKVKASCANCDVTDYEALKKYANDNKLAKVPDYINEWKKESLDSTKENWLASIVLFRKKIHDKIANGQKKERQKITGYERYNSKLDSIINGLKPTEKHQQSLGQEPMIGGRKAEEPKEGESYTENNNILTSLLTWQGITLATCGIVCSIVLIVRRNKKKVRVLKTNITELRDKRKTETDKLNWEIDSLQTEKKKLKETILRLEEELRIEQEKTKINKQQYVVDEQKTMTAPKVESKIKYACYADQGDGFSTSSLLSQSNNETIFDINLISSSTANYKISNNSAIQRYALSNAAFFLGTTCKYDTEPNSQQEIVTEKPGELKLQGNKWLITAPAIISFR